MITIFEEELYWNGKLIVQTYHFKEELEQLKKSIYYVMDILENGEHVLVAKNMAKYNAFYPLEDKYLCLSYVEKIDKIILVHIKPISKKTAVKRKWQ